MIRALEKGYLAACLRALEKRVPDLDEPSLDANPSIGHLAELPPFLLGAAVGTVQIAFMVRLAVVVKRFDRPLNFR